MYRGRLQKDLDIWVTEGLVERSQADAMLAELDGRASAFSFGGVLMILAAVLLSASLLLMVAAGWEEIPRPVKIAAIFALIWIFHLAAAVALSRDAHRLGSGFLVLGSASFGGAVALVGQQYHLSGDAVDAMLLWFAMTALSCLAFRSAALTYACGLLAWAAFATFLDQFSGSWSPFHAAAVVATALVMAALILWTGATRARHFVYTLALAFLFWLYTLSESNATAAAMAVTGLLLFVAVSVKSLPLLGNAVRMDAAPGFYTLGLSLMGLLLLHFDLDEGLRMAVLAIATLGTCILALALRGRDNGAVRFLAYTAFAVEILYLSFVTIDSMLGTSGFFLLSGFVVAALAFVVVRLERLFAARAKREASA